MAPMIHILRIWLLLKRSAVMERRKPTPHIDEFCDRAKALMAAALILLDKSGKSVAAAHLDHAICALGVVRHTVELEL